jgi:superfamily I DNA/RNA helicase
LGDYQRYKQNITIQSVPNLLERVLIVLYQSEEVEDARQYETDYEAWVRSNVKEILAMEPDRFRVFDAVYIDEIQDFDNYFLLVLDHFLKGKRFFFVGDIGQKIFERSYDLQRLGIIPHRIELPKSYQMYRTPKYIGKLAVSFVLRDAYCRQDFEEHGYKGNFQYPNNLDNVAEILKSNKQAEDIYVRIQVFLNRHYIEDDILVIASSHVLNEVQSLLNQNNIPWVEGEPENYGYVALVEFQDAKGLEREIVFVAGIEELYERTKPNGLFWEEGLKITREGLSRRMIYVAITRTIEQLIIYYKDPTNIFISDLLITNEGLLAKRGLRNARV